jgi:hypothetical protein
LAYPQRAGRHPRNRAVFKRSIARSANRSGLKNNYGEPCRGWGGPWPRIISLMPAGVRGR